MTEADVKAALCERIAEDTGADAAEVSANPNLIVVVTNRNGGVINHHAFFKPEPQPDTEDEEEPSE